MRLETGMEFTFDYNGIEDMIAEDSDIKLIRSWDGDIVRVLEAGSVHSNLRNLTHENRTWWVQNKYIREMMKQDDIKNITWR